MARRTGSDTTSVVIGIVAFIVAVIAALVVAVGVVAIVIVACAVVIQLAVKAWRWWKTRPLPAAVPWSTPYKPPPLNSGTPVVDESDWRAYAFPSEKTDAVRKRSLEAMRRSSKARTKDKVARGEPDAEPLRLSMPTIDEEPPRKKIRHGKKLDVIRFDYFNQKGEFSKRRVAVQMVGEWQFEGIDLDKGQERTFRYESVMGDITSEVTGEIQSPEGWRDSIR